MIDATVEGISPRNDGGSERNGWRVPVRVRWILGVASALVVAYLVSLVVRPAGSYTTLVDGFGVAAFELALGAVCMWRAFETTWRETRWVARAFPLLLGSACVAWGLGDLILTFESMGGATPAVPSAADAFYLCFYPLCFLSFALLIRRDSRGFAACHHAGRPHRRPDGRRRHGLIGQHDCPASPTSGPSRPPPTSSTRSATCCWSPSPSVDS